MTEGLRVQTVKELGHLQVVLARKNRRLRRQKDALSKATGQVRTLRVAIRAAAVQLAAVDTPSPADAPLTTTERVVHGLMRALDVTAPTDHTQRIHEFGEAAMAAIVVRSHQRQETT